MIEIKMTAENPQELQGLFAGLGAMVQQCIEVKGPSGEQVLTTDLEKMRKVLEAKEDKRAELIAEHAAKEAAKPVVTKEVAAPPAEEVVTPTTSVKDGVEYEDVDTSAPAETPKKRTRRTKAEIAAEKAAKEAKTEEPAKETTTSVDPFADVPTKATEPVKEDGATELTEAEVRAHIIKARERVDGGVDKVRHMLAEMGGMFADIPKERWPEIVEKADALV